jgi:hypothetical protein
MKYLCLIILITCFKFDSFQTQKQLEIDLVNKEVYFIDLDSEIYQYQNEKQRELASNLIELKLKNVSGKKMLLFINPNEIIFTTDGFYTDIEKYLHHGFLIGYEGKNKRVTTVLTSFSTYLEGLEFKEDHEYNLRQMKYKSMGLAESEKTAYTLYEQFSLVLGINETKTFYFALHLPIIEESNPNLLQNPVRYDKLEESFDFKFVYKASADSIYKHLPNFVKEELKENEVEIFNGTVYSNSVKLKERY